MSPQASPRFRPTALIALTLGWLGAFTACSVPAERSILEQFFAAARLRDTTILRELATTTFEPLQQGIVTDFEVERVVLVNARKKTVTIDAPVHLPDGVKVHRRLVVTLEQGIRSESAEAARRWIVTKIENAGT